MTNSNRLVHKEGLVIALLKSKCLVSLINPTYSSVTNFIFNQNNIVNVTFVFLY